MDAPTSPMVPSVVASDGQVAIVYCNEAFTFTADHPMRKAPCLICGRPIGDISVGLIGAAALTGEAHPCGAIVSDVFLAHAHHFPMPPAALRSALMRGLQCGISN